MTAAAASSRTPVTATVAVGPSFPDSLLASVQKKSGVPVLLPDQITVRPATNAPTPKRYVGSAAKVSHGSYSLVLDPSPCTFHPRLECAIAFFNAERKGASDLYGGKPISLVGGVHGYVSDVGCGPGGKWGPSVCGEYVVTWHQRGINRAIQIPGGTTAQLTRAANATIANG